MNQQEARAAMTRLDNEIAQLQKDAIAAGQDPMSSDEYGELLADWLEAAHAFYCGDKEQAA